MSRTLKIDTKQTRLSQLSGHLIQNVDFGGCILGKLKKGGTFEVDQADLGGGHWEITNLEVQISGGAMLLATIKEQQHEIRAGFRRVPPGTSLSKAAEMLASIPTTNPSRN